MKHIPQALVIAILLFASCSGRRVPGNPQPAGKPAPMLKATTHLLDSLRGTPVPETRTPKSTAVPDSGLWDWWKQERTPHNRVDI